MLENLVLLHGALGTAAQLHPLKEILKNHFNVHAFDFSGHGIKSYTGELSMTTFANDILHFLNVHNIKQSHLFGYSMGGYAAIKFTLDHPDRVKSIITMGTKFNWDIEQAEKEIKMLNPGVIEEKVPKYAEQLKKTFGEQNWKEVLNNTAQMMRNLANGAALTKNDFSLVRQPIYLTLGSEDKMVTMEETKEVANWLLHGKFQILDGQPHPIEKVDIPYLARVIKNILIGKK